MHAQALTQSLAEAPSACARTHARTHSTDTLPSALLPDRVSAGAAAPRARARQAALPLCACPPAPRPRLVLGSAAAPPARGTAPCISTG